MSPGRTCGTRSGGWTSGAKSYGHLAGRKIDNAGRNKKRRYLARTAFKQRLMFTLDDGESANTGANKDTHTLGQFRTDLQPGLIYRKIRGRDRVIDEVVHLLEIFFIEPAKR